MAYLQGLSLGVHQAADSDARKHQSHSPSRVMHDFARAGAAMVHVVPFTGYFNHGLFNYHPIFFVLLAAANGYQIDYLGLSLPDFP